MHDPDAPFHAHLYFTPETRGDAETVRARLATGTPRPLFIGDLRDDPVGPHPLPQFEIHFPHSDLAALLPVLETCGLRVLVHPLTDDDLADHTTLGHWIGEPLPLVLSTLDPPGMNKGIPRYGKSDF
jgi:DOPA 4,5-dioxygenase